MEKYVIPPFFNLDFKVPALLLLTLRLTIRLYISAEQRKVGLFSPASRGPAALTNGEIRHTGRTDRVRRQEMAKYVTPFELTARTATRNGEKRYAAPACRSYRQRVSQLAEALRLVLS